MDIATVLRKWPRWRGQDVGKGCAIGLVKELPGLGMMARNGYLHREQILASEHDALPPQLFAELSAMVPVSDNHVTRWGATVLNFEGIIHSRNALAAAKARAKADAAAQKQAETLQKGERQRAKALQQAEDKAREEAERKQQADREEAFSRGVCGEPFSGRT